MGQLLSAFKRSRDARRDAQVSSALHEFAEQNPLPTDEHDTSSSLDEIEGVQSSCTNDSSEVWHTDRGSIHDSTPKSLARLPTEIILDIAQHLPPSACMSFSYSCRNIRNKMTVSIEYVLGDKVLKDLASISSPSVELRNYRSLERTALRCLLDRDAQIPSQKVFCNGCEYRHDSSQFSLASLIQPRMERRCLGRAGQVWICPHRTIDFNQATTYGQTKDIHICGGCFVMMTTGYAGYSFDSCSTLWPIMRVPGDDVPSNEQVKEALSRLSAAICPHLRLDDACVARVYLPECRKTRWNFYEPWKALFCPCSTCLSSPPFKDHTIVCKFCRTDLMFGIKHERNGTRTLRLLVTRTFGDGWRCTDRRWICQVAEPADFREYEREWQASNAECRRRLVSDLYEFGEFEVEATTHTFKRRDY